MSHNAPAHCFVAQDLLGMLNKGGRYLALLDHHLAGCKADLEQGTTPQFHQPPDQGYRHYQGNPGHPNPS